MKKSTQTHTQKAASNKKQITILLLFVTVAQTDKSF